MQGDTYRYFCLRQRKQLSSGFNFQKKAFDRYNEWNGLKKSNRLIFYKYLGPKLYPISKNLSKERGSLD